MKKKKSTTKRRSFNHGAVGSIPTGLTKNPHVSSRKTRKAEILKRLGLGKTGNKRADSSRNPAQYRHSAFAQRSARNIAARLAEAVRPIIEEVLLAVRSEIDDMYTARLAPPRAAASPPSPQFQHHLPLGDVASVSNPVADFIRASYVPEIGAAVRLSQVLDGYTSSGGCPISTVRLSKMLRATFGDSCVGKVWFPTDKASGQALLGWRPKAPRTAPPD